MALVSVPAPQLDVSKAPQSEVSGAAFARPNLGTGLQELGQGADQLASSLARQQAQSDVAKSAVTLDANGVPQMAAEHNSIILGQAGQEYQQVWAAGQRAMLNSAVSNQMETIRQQHEGDPQGFLSASTNYASALRQTSYGPEVGNALANQASQEAAQHHTNMVEQQFQLGTRSALSGIQTNIQDTQNKMRVIARQGGIDTPEYQQLQGQLSQNYDALKSNKLFGYAPARADSELASSLSMDRAEAVVGNVDSVFKRTSGDGGRAGAQKYLTDQVLNNPDLHLSEAERRQVYTYGMAHLEYLTSDAKAQIDAMRVNVDKFTASVDAHKQVDPAVINQLMTQAQSLGDSESVMKIAAYAGQAQKAAPYAGLPDEQKLQAMTGNDYVTKLARVEGGSNPTGGNGGGAFQFQQTTWDALARAHPELQLTPDGRTDPAQSGRAIVAFTNDNAKTLQSAGLQPTDANLRMTHFLGAGAGPAFLKQMAANPTGSAAATNLAAATANPTIFYKPGANGKPDPSQPRSYQEVYALQTRGFGGTTPVVSSATQGAPTPAQMKANPFTMTAYLDSLKSEDDVKTAKAVGDAMAIQLGQGNFPRAETMAAFQQVAERHPDQLGELNQKLTQVLAPGAAAGQAAAAAGPGAGQAFLQQVETIKRSGGADLLTLQRAEAAQKIYEKGAANLKADPYGEAANRGWIARPPAPLDFSGSQQSPPIAQQLGERVQAAQAIASHTGQQQPLFGESEMKLLQQSMPLAPAPAVQATMSALATLPPQQLDQLGADKGFKATVMGLAHSGDPVKMNAAFSFLDAQYRRNPMTFQAEDPQALKELRTWQTLSSFKDPVTVAKRMGEANDPDVVKAKDALGTVAEKALANLDSSNVVRAVYGTHVPLVGSYIPFTAPGEIASDRPAQASGALLADYREAYTDMYKETGDAGASDSYAKETLANKYSVSALNGGRVMAYAPDRVRTDPDGAGEVGAYYPKVNGSFDWLQHQLASDVSNSRFAHDFRIDNPKRSYDYALLPDATTEADIAAHRPPSYRVVATGNDGRLHVVEGDIPGRPMRFRGDAARAQREAAPALAAQREALGAAEADNAIAPTGGT